jgi:hypothetical protein
MKIMLVIDNETTSKIKRALADTISNDYKDVLMRNKAAANVASIIDYLPINIVNKPNNTNDEVR